MTRSTTHRAKGGATVETALGILVIIPVVLYGIHFAEVGIAQMKVTEAANAPLWDATAFPMHITSVPPSYSAFLGGAITVSQTVTNLRYARNWDGRVSRITTSRTGLFTGSPLVQYGQSLTGAGMLDVKCAGTKGSGLPADLSFAPPFVSLAIPDNGGIACRGEGAAFNLLPTTFLEKSSGGGLFKASMKESLASRFAIRMCSLGRPSGLNGACVGVNSMMMDDWGLASGADGAEASNCEITVAGIPCSNWPYYAVAKQLYELATMPMSLMPTAPHRLLVKTLLGSIPYLMYTDTMFYMSFTGEDRAFLMAVLAWDSEFPIHQTTPFYWPTSYGLGYGFRSKCYLGMSGC